MVLNSFRPQGPSAKRLDKRKIVRTRFSQIYNADRRKLVEKQYSRPIYIVLWFRFLPTEVPQLENVDPFRRCGFLLSRWIHRRIYHGRRTALMWVTDDTHFVIRKSSLREMGFNNVPFRRMETNFPFILYWNSESNLDFSDFMSTQN